MEENHIQEHEVSSNFIHFKGKWYKVNDLSKEDVARLYKHFARSSKHRFAQGDKMLEQLDKLLVQAQNYGDAFVKELDEIPCFPGKERARISHYRQLKLSFDLMTPAERIEAFEWLTMKYAVHRLNVKTVEV